MISFHVPGEPRGKGRPRASKRGAFIRMHTDEQTLNYEGRVAFAARAAMGEQALMTGPLFCDVLVCHTPPGSWSGKKKAAALAGLWRAGKPDLDNVLKIVTDAMNGIVYGDDKQLAAVSVRQVYADRQGVTVTVVPVWAGLWDMMAAPHRALDNQ